MLVSMKAYEQRVNGLKANDAIAEAGAEYAEGVKLVDVREALAFLRKKYFSHEKREKIG